MYRLRFKPEFERQRYGDNDWENIDNEDLGSFDEKHVATHAMNRNLQRDIPFFYDGLKTVQRRLLYSMALMGLWPDKKDHKKNMTKAAGVIGEVLTRFHPHGELSSYKALIYMRQPWRHLLPLIDFNGNYGTAKDPNSYAHMRYVSARLSEFAYDCFFDSDEWDLKSDLVDRRVSFNGKDLEPIYLPAKYPLFLMGWSSGIGHGLSTSSPGFLPQDAMQTVITLIDNPDADFVLYPEDPLGCTILDKKVFKKFVDYTPTITDDTNLTFRVRSNYSVTKDTIIVHNTPFEVNPVMIEKRIKELVIGGKLDGISDIEINLRPGTIPQLGEDGNTAEIIIDVKKGFDPHILMDKLYKVTELQVTFPLNCVYVMTDHNVKFNLRQSILTWINLRRRVLKRMFRLRLSDDSKRIYVLDALIKIFDKNGIETVIKIIKNNKRQEAINLLIKSFDISDYQANQIQNMRIRDLSPESYDDYVNERKKLMKKIDEVQEILKSKKGIDKLIKKQMEEGIQKYSRKRLSKVINLSDDSVDDESTHIVAVTDTTFVKKLSTIDDGLGKLPQDSKFIFMRKAVSNAAKLFMFTPSGRVFSEFVHKIKLSSIEGVGMYFRRKMKTDDIQFTSAVAALTNTKSSLIFVTKRGGVKQTKTENYFATSQNSTATRLQDGDSLVSIIESTSDKDRILIYTKNGKCGLFNVKDITLTSRTTVGVIGIRLEDGDEVIGACLVASNHSHFITVSIKGEFKRVSLETSLTSMRRGDLGVDIMARSEELNAVFSIDSKTKSIMILAGDELKEIDIETIPIRTRLSNGEKLINWLRGYQVVRVND